MTGKLKRIFNYIPGYKTHNKKLILVSSIYYLLMLYEVVSGGNRALALGALLLPFAGVFIYESIKNKTLIKLLPTIIFFAIMGYILANFTCHMPNTANSNNITVSSDSEVQSDGELKDESVESTNALSDGAPAKPIKSDGDEVNNMSPNPAEHQSDISNKDLSQIVYVGKSGSKYHSATCHTLKEKGTAVSLEEALAQGKQACKICAGH